MTVHDTDRSPNSSACDGFIIVAVLWILVALATLASIYSIYINNSALALSGMDDGLQAEALVSAGLELTAFRLTVPKDKDSDRDKDKNKDKRGTTPNARSICFPAWAGQCHGQLFFGDGAD